MEDDSNPENAGAAVAPDQADQELNDEELLAKSDSEEEEGEGSDPEPMDSSIINKPTPTSNQSSATAGYNFQIDSCSESPSLSIPSNNHISREAQVPLCCIGEQAQQCFFPTVDNSPCFEEIERKKICYPKVPDKSQSKFEKHMNNSAEVVV